MLEEIDRTNPNIRLILTMTDGEDWPGESGRIDATFFEEYLGRRSRRGAVHGRSVDEELISTDSFSGY